jgi:hypothetical protein
MLNCLFCLPVCIFLLGYLPAGIARHTEEERVALWYKANNTWPPKWQQNSVAFQEAMKRREEELLMIPGADERWENFMQYTQSLMVPRLTPMGFKLIQTPASVQSKLKAKLDKALENWEAVRTEPHIDAIYTPLPSKFIDLTGLEWQILGELKELHEEWAGLDLIGTSAYGIRAYQNGSSLVMHYDKVGTHVISSIIHVGHEYYDDDKPWPIEIEDHDGNIHAINLEPGQVSLIYLFLCFFPYSPHPLCGRCYSMKVPLVFMGEEKSFKENIIPGFSFIINLLIKIYGIIRLK